MKFIRILLLTLILLILCAFNITTTNVFTTIEASVRITRRIQIPFIVDGLTVEFFLPTDYTNGINIQKITEQNMGSVVGRYILKKIITDRYGNKKLKMVFNKNPQNSIFIDYGFKYSVRVKPIVNRIHSHYPLSRKRLKKFYNYLSFTKKAQPANSFIYGLIKKLSNQKRFVYKIVLSLFNWVHKNVVHDANVGYDDGLTTFLNRKGNFRGILNLLAILLRAAKIPCRIVKGISIDKSFLSNAGENKIEIKYPKGYYYWIEIYFPTRAWVPFDFFASYFFLPDNIIRLCVGRDTEDVKDTFLFSNGIVPDSIDNIFSEGINKKSVVRARSAFNNSLNILSLPPGNEAEFIAELSRYNSNAPVLNYHGAYLKKMNFPTYPVYSFNVNEKVKKKYPYGVKIKILKNKYYAQAILIKNLFFIDKVSIPLLIAGIYPSSVWVEIYKDDQGKPGKLYARSYKKMIKVMNQEVSLHDFFFQRKKWPYLNSGKYWFCLRTDKDSQVYWYGMFGNAIGENSDTRKNIKEKWAIISHLDFMIQIHGNYEKRPD